MHCKWTLGVKCGKRGQQWGNASIFYLKGRVSIPVLAAFACTGGVVNRRNVPSQCEFLGEHLLTERADQLGGTLVTFAHVRVQSILYEKDNTHISMTQHFRQQPCNFSLKGITVTPHLLNLLQFDRKNINPRRK